MRSDASHGSAFAHLGDWLARHALLVVACFAVLLAAAAFYGSSVARHLPGGGLEVPGSESARAMEEAARRFGVGSADVLALYRSADVPVQDPRVAFALLDSLDPVIADPGVLSVTSVFDSAQKTLVSRDGHETLVMVSLRGSAEEKLRTYERIEPGLRAVEPPLSVALGGLVPFTRVVQEIAERDVLAAERVALPIALALTLVFFRSVVAALLPILIGAFAVAGGAALTRLGTNWIEISIFAMNVGAFLGLGLSIDYALLLVQRFREELARGLAPRPAIAATLATAGRSIWVSGITVVLSLGALVPVPLPILRSVAIGGAFAVASALAASLLLLPALLAWLGPNVNRLPIGRLPDATRPSELWRKIGRFSTGHPIVAGAACLALLAVIASPALRMRSAMPDSRALPPGSEARLVDQALSDPARFDPGVASAIPIVIETRGASLEPANLRALRTFASHVDAKPGVSGVRSPFDALDPDTLDAAALAGAAAREPTASMLRRMNDGNVALLVAENGFAWRSPESAAAVEAIRRVPHPGLDVQVGGATAQMVDTVSTLQEYGGVALLLVAAWNFLILLGAFRSLVLPLKAVLMNLLAVGASYGLLVFVFQEGHFTGLLGFEQLDGIDPTIPLVLFAVMFGLSMDYEVFMLSRIQEEWRRTGDDRESVVEGIARTGRIVTSAALILLVVVGAFLAGDLVYVKQMGLGIGAAIALDVTLVRALLVPATMRLLGRWNWWAPRWLRADRTPERPLRSAHV
jgi:RND superfamily putative drug exporter